MNIGIWDKEFRRTKEAKLITRELTNELTPIFDKAIGMGLSPEAVCFLVNEVVHADALRYSVSNSMKIRKENL